MPTYTEAYNEVVTMFTQGWDTGATAVLGSAPKVYIQGLEDSDNPPTNDYWVHIKLNPVAEGQATFNNVSCSKRYENVGVVTLMIASPRSTNGSILIGRQLAEVARNIFRGKSTPNAVWFREPVVTESETDQTFYYHIVLINYTYDERG